MQIKILLVDDEARMRALIRDYGELEGYSIDEAGDGQEALDLFQTSHYDLVVLDIMMPKIDGWTVCREIRKSSQVPIIMLSARGEEYDKLFGFELGVDDYIVKPFSPKELMARIKAILRRGLPADGDRASFAGLVIDFAARTVYVDDVSVRLTPKEFDLLSFLVGRLNRVFSREQLLQAVWGYDFTGDHRTVDSHIKMLRDSLGPYRKFIVTVWGVGYKFEDKTK